MPDIVENPRTNKQKLWNSVIRFLSEKNCMWKNIEVSSSGCSLVQALSNTLWYIDGQYDTFQKQGYLIPAIFGVFQNYNRPDLSKHRKRQQNNMSGTVLKSLSSHLFTCLQGVYWNRDCWKVMKLDVEQLTNAIEGYSLYLQRSCKKVIHNQSLSSPVREISEHLSFQFLPTSHVMPDKLKDLHDHLDQLSELVSVPVEQFSPSDPKEKYQYLQTLKSNGFPFPTSLLTYSHGNNVGNLNFVWRVHAISESSFSECQPVVEAIKKNIPTYHTRAMRKEISGLFGKLTSSVKPAVIRHIYRTITGRNCSRKGHVPLQGQGQVF